jgi:peptidoglycan/LPS O-acetylase OafA/YrhL
MKKLLARLGRETSGAAVIPEIDGLRFFAIGSVVVYHVYSVLVLELSRVPTPYQNANAAVAFGPAAMDHPLRGVIEQGWFGVQLFFAISGFVLGLPFARQYLGAAPPVSLRRYFLRRLTRLEPPYLINVAVYTLVWLAVKPRPAAEVLPHTLASMAYLHNLVYLGQDPLSSVLWSLEVEVQFYILAPLLTTVFLIHDRTVRRAVLVAGMLLIGALEPVAMALVPFHGTLLHQLPFFLAGFLLVDFYLTEWREAPPRHPAWDLLVFAAVAATLVLLQRRNRLVDVLTPFLILAAYVGAFRGAFWRAIVRHPVIFTVGGMCYTTYLYHLMLITALKPWTTRLALTDGFLVNFALQNLLMGPVIVGTSALLFFFLEKPFMRRDWPRLLAARVRSVARREAT